MKTVKANDYKVKQNLAMSLEISFNAFQRTSRESANDFHANTLEQIIALNVFASEVAKTVKASRKIDDCHIKGGYRLSSKQAWILACAMVENGIKW